MQIVKIEKPEFQLPDDTFEKYTSLEIKSDADSGFLADRCKEIKTHITATETQRKRYTAKLDDIKKEMIRDERSITDPLNMLLKIFKAKITNWLVSQEEIRAKAAREAQKKKIEELRAEQARQLQVAVATDDVKAMDVVETIEKNVVKMESRPVTVDTAARGDAGVSSLLTYWRFEVIAADKIPREFLTPDLKKIGAYVRTRKEAAEIPGVRIYAERTVGGR